MKKTTRFMSAFALTGMIGLATAAPVLAAETATGGTDISYTANSASPDNADWLVSYPRKVVISDYNDAANNGVSLAFELKNKDDSQAYSGDRTITVSVTDYATPGYQMAGGNGGTVTMGLANSGKTELSTGGTLGTMKKKNAGTENAVTGYAFLKAKTGTPEGTYTKTVTFTFTDDAA